MKTENVINRKISLVLLLSICCVGAARSQEIMHKQIAKLVSVENAFAAKASETNIKTAFLANLDSTGILFNGPDPVNGLTLYQKAPDGGKDLLSWYPVVAAAASAGDLGFTSGPYKYFTEQGKNPVGSGYFFSIWKRNEAGNFKLLLDMGSPNSKNHDEAFVRNPKPENINYDYSKFTGWENEKKEDHWDAEKQFVELASKNPVEAYRKFLGDSSWMLRNDNPAGNDKITNLDLINDLKVNAYHFTQFGEGISKGRDFAYCYGNVRGIIAGLEKEKSGVYVRVWQYQKEGWRIIGEEVSLY